MRYIFWRVHYSLCIFVTAVNFGSLFSDICVTCGISQWTITENKWNLSESVTKDVEMRVKKELNQNLRICPVISNIQRFVWAQTRGLVSFSQGYKCRFELIISSLFEFHYLHCPLLPWCQTAGGSSSGHWRWWSEAHYQDSVNIFSRRAAPYGSLTHSEAMNDDLIMDVQHDDLNAW